MVSKRKHWKAEREERKAKLLLANYHILWSREANTVDGGAGKDPAGGKRSWVRSRGPENDTNAVGRWGQEAGSTAKEEVWTTGERRGGGAGEPRGRECLGDKEFNLLFIYTIFPPTSLLPPSLPTHPELRIPRPILLHLSCPRMHACIRRESTRTWEQLTTCQTWNRVL